MSVKANVGGISRAVAASAFPDPVQVLGDGFPGFVTHAAEFGEHGNSCFEFRDDALLFGHLRNGHPNVADDLEMRDAPGRLTT